MAIPTKLSVDRLDLRGKRVFLRADFNVPLAGETISDDARIRAVLPTVEHCLKSGARVVLASHLRRPKGTRDPRFSLKPVAFRLEELLGRGIPLAPDCVGPDCYVTRCVLRIPPDPCLGYETGFSVVDLNLVDTAKEILAEARASRVEILLPEDLIVAAHPEDRTYVSTQPASKIPCATMGLDIGPATPARFHEALPDTGTILWNGPMGMCERPAYAVGTTEPAKAVAESSALSVAGGGDTVAAIERAGVAAKFSHLSMGGGAFLEYLEGRELPGVAALTEVGPGLPSAAAA